MEKLDSKVQESIKKMSSDRLKIKLVKAGLDEDDVAEMSRELLINSWAEMVATGRDAPKPAAAAAAARAPV